MIRPFLCKFLRQFLMKFRNSQLKLLRKCSKETQKKSAWEFKMQCWRFLKMELPNQFLKEFLKERHRKELSQKTSNKLPKTASKIPTGIAAWISFWRSSRINFQIFNLPKELWKNIPIELFPLAPLTAADRTIEVLPLLNDSGDTSSACEVEDNKKNLHAENISSSELCEFTINL